MNKQVAGLWAVLFCGALLAGGCAKEELVKKDEPLAQATAQAKPAQPQTAKADVKSAPIQQGTVVSTAVAAPPNEAKDKGVAEQAKVLAELDRIYFDFDAATLSDQARATLAKNADILKRNAATRISIAGNCDERGSDEYNLALGEKRAKAALQYLVTLGIPAERLSTISYGKEKPAVAGHDEAAWAKNRRDEFTIVAK